MDAVVAIHVSQSRRWWYGAVNLGLVVVEAPGRFANSSGLQSAAASSSALFHCSPAHAPQVAAHAARIAASRQ